MRVDNIPGYVPNVWAQEIKDKVMPEEYLGEMAPEDVRNTDGLHVFIQPPEVKNNMPKKRYSLLCCIKPQNDNSKSPSFPILYFQINDHLTGKFLLKLKLQEEQVTDTDAKKSYSSLEEAYKNWKDYPFPLTRNERAEWAMK